MWGGEKWSVKGGDFLQRKGNFFEWTREMKGKFWSLLRFLVGLMKDLLD
jgi:hypothetical protein